METKLLKPDEAGIDEAADLLRRGQIVAIPTETVYGLAADALNPAAVADIFAAKGRPMDNPLIVHIADIDQWAALVTDIPDNARKLAENFWPGPLTIILPAAPCVPKETTGGLSTVAVRFPSHPVAQAVILHSGCPLAAPSANRSGAPSPTNAARVEEDMYGRIPAIVDGGDSAVGVESTVIDLCGRHPRLLRPGGITPEMLEEVIGPIEIDPAVTHALKKGAVAASPGMKYKHYAPKAHVRLIKGTSEGYIHYVNTHAAPGVAALCFDEEKERLTVPAISYGAREDASAQAQQVFDRLRQLDEIGADTVYAACPKPRGVGLAVYNRMIRAAAFDIINTIRVIGLTGPTGSGKSTVAAVWRNAGIPIIDADAVAREVTAPGSPVLDRLAEAFSGDILRSDGTLDRAALAHRAFADKQSTHRLNEITHPAITALIRQRLEDAADSGASVAVLDAPTLFEAGADALCDHIVVVTAPEEIRLQRIMERDHLTKEDALQRIRAQHSTGFYLRDGVTEIQNSGTAFELEQKAATILREGWWSADGA